MISNAKAVCKSCGFLLEGCINLCGKIKLNIKVACQ